MSEDAIVYYRVTLVVKYLGWVDLDAGSSFGWWAATAKQDGETYQILVNPTKVFDPQSHPVFQLTACS